MHWGVYHQACGRRMLERSQQAGRQAGSCAADRQRRGMSPEDPAKARCLSTHGQGVPRGVQPAGRPAEACAARAADPTMAPHAAHVLQTQSQTAPTRPPGSLAS